MHLTLNENHVKTPLTDDCVPRYAMNHPFDLLTALRYNDNNVYIDEAILSTWKISRDTDCTALPKHCAKEQASYN